MVTTHRIPFQTDTLAVLAQDLLREIPGAPDGDLSSALVLLPGARACRALGHAILEASGRYTLLLPRIQTVSQWSGEMAVAVGVPGYTGPDNRLRPLILAPRLAGLPWLADNPESAPGLARELIVFFDEARLHGQAELLLDPARLAELQTMAGAAEAEVVAQDMARVYEAWSLYRAAVPGDATDHLLAVAEALAKQPPQPLAKPELVMVAAFGRVDPTRAVLLRTALASGQNGRLYLPQATGPLATHFLTTWGATGGATDPLAPTRAVEKLLTDTESVPPPAATTLRGRLDALRQEFDPADLLAPRGPLQLVPCGSAEAESRFIAGTVAAIQNEPDSAQKSITIAVNDPKLAARIRAHLKDAGIDVDDTHGDPLAALPSGLLVRFLLRAALTDLRIEPLLEVLTHPYVQLPVSEGYHGQWTLRLEQMYRRDKGPQGGLAALWRRAGERDEAALNLFRDYHSETGAGMVAFVTRIADAFGPLLPFRDGAARPWSELVAALRASWSQLAPEYELGADNKSRADISKLHNLLAQLEKDAAWLPPATLAEFSSELGRLLAAENAAAHRKAYLPVVIAGMVEARLERADVLILAGLRDGVFPKKNARPLFLAGALRERLGLPGWPAALARDAELFTRLLHGAPRVVLTWATEDGGAPALPSAFVSRLHLVLPKQAVTADEDRQWRTSAIPWEEISATEKAFRPAGEVVRATVPIRPLTRLSWSALRTWRDCPYRALLERGFALRREEEVQAEFQAMDYGTLVHKTLQDWLAEDGNGYAALVRGDGTAARQALDTVAAAYFEQGADELPQRQLWLATFQAAFGGLVQVELARFADWRPVALEKEFSLGLSDLRDWVLAEARKLGIDPAVPELPDHAGDVGLRGTIDRIDLAQDGTGAFSVIDYKTGQLPSAKQVAELEEMQILLYAAAVEMGAVDLPGQERQIREGFYYAINPEKPGGPTKPHLIAADDGRAVLVRGAASLVDLAVRMSDPGGEFPLLPREIGGDAPTRLPCTYCDFRGVCRVEEVSLPAATERKLDKLVNRKDQG